MSKPIILMIDDNAEAFDRVYRYFRDIYELRYENDPFAGVAIAKELQPYVIILDLRMPELDGFEVCRRLRGDKRTREIPIVVYSVDGDEDAAYVRSLDLGAHVVVEKDKLKRLGAVLERLTGEKGRAHQKLLNIYNAGHELKIQGEAERVWLDGEEKILPPKIRDLLAVIARKPGVFFTSEQLINLVYDNQHGFSSPNIARLIYDLRAIVEPRPKSPLFILSERRIGYRLYSE